MLVTSAATAVAAPRRVPPGWLGVTADGPVRADDAGEWDDMVRAGVQGVRTAFFWSQLQPYPARAAVPATDGRRFAAIAGTPTDFAPTDALVAAAARRGLTVLPVVQAPPVWASVQPGVFASPPSNFGALQRFCRALAGRYGPHGTLWAQRPRLPRVPIRAWQVFNEPQLTQFWTVQPFEAAYVRTLRAARRGLRSADPHATVVLGGATNDSWAALRRIYAAGARRLFDVVAIHPYARRPVDVLRVIQRDRRVMAAHGDARKPIWLTEFGWPSARGRAPGLEFLQADEHEQAARLNALLPLLAAARKRLNIARAYWYTWLSTEGPGVWDYAGLRRIRGATRVDTPALRVYRRWARRLETP